MLAIIYASFKIADSRHYWMGHKLIYLLFMLAFTLMNTIDWMENGTLAKDTVFIMDTIKKLINAFIVNSYELAFIGIAFIVWANIIITIFVVVMIIFNKITDILYKYMYGDE